MSSSKKKIKVKQAPPLKNLLIGKQKNQKLTRTLGGIVAIVAAAQYIQTISYGFVLDDFSAIIENKVTLQGFSGLSEIFKTSYRYGYPIQGDELYRPLTKSVFAIFWQLFPNNPLPGHLLNILLYAFTGFLLFTTLAKFLKQNLYVPFIASLLFIAHPVHTDAVTNIKSLDEIMSFFFFLVSLNWLYEFLATKKRRWMILSVLSYFAALLSKESAITFLAVYPLVIFFFTERPVAKSISASAIMLIPVFVFLIIRFKVIGQTAPPSMADNALMATNDLLTRKASAIYILGLYLLKLFFPHPLTFDYSYNQIPLVGITDWKFLLSFVVYSAMLIYAIMKWKKKDLIAFGILFYLITISISSNVFMIIGTHMAERLLYTPSFGFCFAIAAISDKFIAPKKPAQLFDLKNFLSGRAVLFGVVAIVLVIFSLKTWTQNPVWKSNETLYLSGVQRSPNSHRTHYYYGQQLVKPEYYSKFPKQQQDSIIQRGLAELRKSVSIYPGYGDGWLHIGNYYSSIHQDDSAEFYFKKAIDVMSYLATAHNNLGTVYFDEKKYDAALAEFNEAVRLDPNYQNAYCNLGSAYGTLGKFQEAIPYFQKAYQLSPTDAQTCYFLGITYRSLGDEVNAKIYLDKAAALDPKFKK
ncbi:MAG: tetratricopeptide repeat protein, partial [Chitinophagales bacterium]